MSPKPLSRNRHAPRTLCLALTAAFAATAHAATDLTALSLEQLLEVTVVGASKYEQKQSEVAAAVSVITRGEIQAFGWRTLADALASLPGIHTTYDRQYTYLGTRGFGLPGDLTARVLITINGNRVNDPVYDGGPVGRDFPLDMALVERIEFIPGPGGAVYGQNAMFGVVNVITRTGADLDGVELAAAAQHPQRLREGRVSWGRRLDNGVDVVLSASGLRSRGEDRFFDYGSTGISGVAVGLDAERDREFYARIGRGAWALDVVYGDRLLSTAVAGHKLMLGIEAQDNVRTDQSVNDLADPANSFTIAQSGYRIGIYAQDEWRVGATLTATLGLRVDRNNATGTKTSPRAALIWQATPATTLKALAGRAHRAPNVYESQYDDVFSQVSNPALDGERIDTIELVADHRIGSDLALRGSLYEWTMHDIVTLGLDPVSGLTQYQSGEKVKARGLELSADKTWASGARLRGSVAAQDVAYASGGALLNSPKLLGKLNLSAPLPWAGLRAGYEWRYDSRRLTLDGSKLGGHAVSNLHLSTEALAKGLELSLGIQNLFDKRYAHPGADTNWQNSLEQDGRSVRLSADYRF